MMRLIVFVFVFVFAPFVNDGSICQLTIMWIVSIVSMSVLGKCFTADDIDDCEEKEEKKGTKEADNNNNENCIQK